jgi:enamine deaminase RidA (YjgF/YER057c/UK114 family)|tara:strand:+ start:26 stop:319 length:294 start_codon:yes stop_codon:yes gene_type:complete
MANAHIRNRPTAENTGILTGAGGSDYVTGATINAHTYVAIQALSVDCVVSATSVDTDIWDTLTDVTIKAGQTIYGKYSAVTVAADDFAMVYRESSSD